MYLFTITIVLLLFILDITLSTLDYSNRKKPIPDNVKDIYAPEEYQKWLSYKMENFKLSIISKITSSGILIVFLVFNLFTKVADISSKYSENQIIQTIIFLALFFTINYVLTIGFDIYKTFNIEARYGFNTTSIKTFIKDQIISILMLIIIGTPVLYSLLFLFEQLGINSVIYSWLIIVTIIILINILYTRVFIKLFNKLTPLAEDELFFRARKLANDMGYEIKTISVMDASKRSTRLNAFFSGFGKFKSIILYDTLVEKCSTDEILSVLAHEIGHSKNKDVLKNIFASILQIGLYLLILSYFLSSSSLSQAFGFSNTHYGFVLILFGILLEPIAILINLPLNYFSRKAEYRADALAVEYGFKDAMISTLKVLAKVNFANLTPHPIVVKLTYSHPTISQRIDSILQQ